MTAADDRVADRGAGAAGEREAPAVRGRADAHPESDDRSGRPGFPTPREEITGVWRATARGWKVFVPTLVLNAAAQTALVRFGVTPQLDATFLLLVVGSLVAAALALGLIVAAAVGSARGTRMRFPLRLFIASGVVVLLFTAVGAVAVPAGIAVAILGSFVLCSLAERMPVLRYARALRRTPLRTLAWVGASVAVLLLAWLVAFHAVLFLGGVFGTSLAWAAWTAASIVIACGIASLGHRAHAAEERVQVG